MKVLISILVGVALTIASISAQCQKKSNALAYVDQKGALRWRGSNEEVCAFGVNYTSMFAHAYRTAKKMNVDLEQAISDDVYHFSRLGFDAFRVHVWDCEISDSLGNLLENDHMRLFDFAISKMKERGMKFVITPIAYWGNGYPEPDDKTPGFSTKYGKDNCLTNPDAIRAQQRYLNQFLNHVNKYTGNAYKDDPDVIAFEICNEPHHKGSPDEVTAFITGMVTAMRKTGCEKPIFYNVSHSIHLEDAYFRAPIQGGTFQWYPTGLGARHELGGNLLPNVDRYTIPFGDLPAFKRAARIVYEFDAADVGRSYIYPAMTRSFRSAGMQVATHFAYDPTFMAFSNTEYNTHFMNLVYAPQKALSLKIAAEVFHKVPLNKSYGSYPGNATFDGFHVSYENDLAELVSNEKFFYTNNTESKVPNAADLQHIAGFGSSSVVAYTGTGAYFLDKLENGVWRLELMPDAVWIRDPFRRSGPDRDVAEIQYNEWPMTIHLPDLGAGFVATPLNDNNKFQPTANNEVISVRPGAYLLVAKGKTTKWRSDSRSEHIILREFVAPASRIASTTVIHQPLTEFEEAKELTIKAQVVSKDRPASVELFVFSGGFRPERIPMTHDEGFSYSATINASTVREGFLRYYITVTIGDCPVTFPGNVPGRPSDWGFGDDQPYSIRVSSKNSPLYLFNASTDADHVVRQWMRGSVLKPGPEPDKALMNIKVDKLYSADPENKNATAVYDYSFRYFFGDKINGRRDDLINRKKIVVAAQSSTGKPCSIQVALVMRDGSAYGGMLPLDPSLKNNSLDLAQLQKVKTVILPRPYPSFLPYFFEDCITKPFDIREIESIQFSIGPGLSEVEGQEAQGVAIESVRLE